MLKSQLIGSDARSASRPTGKYFLYWKDNKFQAYDLDAGTTKTLGGGSAASASSTWSSIIRARSRRTASRATRPTARRVIVEHRYDLWLVPLDGSAPTQPDERRRREERDPIPLRANRSATTPGAGGPRRRRIRRRSRRWRARARRSISSKPVTLSAYGEWTKKAGFYELAERRAEGARLRGRVVQQSDARPRRPTSYLFTRQTFVEFPDLRVSGPGLQGREEDQRRQPAAGRVHLGPSRAVRLQGQGRPQAAGHPRDSRRLQAGREAADAGELLREELAEPAPLHRAVVSHRHGLVADRRR